MNNLKIYNKEEIEYFFGTGCKVEAIGEREIISKLDLASQNIIYIGDINFIGTEECSKVITTTRDFLCEIIRLIFKKNKTELANKIYVYAEFIESFTSRASRLKIFNEQPTTYFKDFLINTLVEMNPTINGNNKVGVSFSSAFQEIALRELLRLNYLEKTNNDFNMYAHLGTDGKKSPTVDRVKVLSINIEKYREVVFSSI